MLIAGGSYPAGPEIDGSCNSPYNRLTKNNLLTPHK
jgi:hypothetical protein